MKKTTIILTSIILMGACKNYLDIKPYGKTIPKAAEEFSALLHKQINDIDYGEEHIVGNVISSGNFECFSDNLETNLTVYPGGNSIPAYIGEQLSGQQKSYVSLYESISTTNIIIGNMTDKTSDEARNVLGTAHALRGICYYQLMRQFCDAYDAMASTQLGVPLVTEFNMEEKPTRGSINETISLIERDLSTALKYNVNNEVFRINSDVVKGYLARLYFWVEQYDKAIPYAHELLGKYPLLNGEQYKEMITSNVARKGNVILKSGMLTDASFDISYGAMKQHIKTRPVSRRFISLFAEENNDIRYGLSMEKKRIVTKTLFAGMRSAEFALILAESYYHTGQQDRALEELNQFRRTRISPYTNYTMATLPTINGDDYIKIDARGNVLTPLLYAILSERRKELFMEGDRWFELKRNGCPEFWIAKHGLKYYTRRYMYTFPLPIKDFILVKGLVQNPGYEKTQ